MRSRPLFELLVVRHTSKLFINITDLGSQAAHINDFLVYDLTIPFVFVKRLLHEIFACFTWPI